MHRLKRDILEASSRRGIDPYKNPFTPSDLGLNASDYGSFADHCSEMEARAGIYNPNILLKVVEYNKKGKPKKYLLIR